MRFDVVMPEHGAPPGGPPKVEGIPETSEDPGELLVWHQEYGAFIPESLRPATAVHRVAITSVEGSTYTGRDWFTPDHQLAQFIDGWFDGVRTWVEILTGQDLDPSHRVYDAESVGAGLTFIEPPHQDALGLTITTSRVRPLQADEWAAVLNFVREGTEPPLEEVLSRDARAAQRRGANRRAVIDAATALEISLGHHVRSLANELPEAQRRRINDRTALGGYISIAEASGISLAVPFEVLHHVKDLRNDAAHRGEAPDNLQTARAVRAIVDFLSAHGRYPRRRVSEPDGGEIQLH